MVRIPFQGFSQKAGIISGPPASPDATGEGPSGGGSTIHGCVLQIVQKNLQQICSE
jgi:hypothetical protein